MVVTFNIFFHSFVPTIYIHTLITISFKLKYEKYLRLTDPIINKCYLI